MSLSDEFENLLKRNYIFHLHTNYTDGLSSVEDYCLWASRNEYDAIVFTEHVRRKMSYNFYDFLSEIENARQKFPNIDIWVGAEAKMLPDGKLDIPDEILHEIGIICFACHSFPKDVDLYEKSSKRLFSDSQWKDHIRIWVHPGNFLRRLGPIDNYSNLLNRLISFAIREGVFIERNLEHELPPLSIIKNIPQSNLAIGLDAHSVKSAVELVRKYK